LGGVEPQPSGWSKDAAESWWAPDVGVLEAKFEILLCWTTQAVGAPAPMKPCDHLGRRRHDGLIVVSRDSDWLVPLEKGGSPVADRRWAWSELTLLPAEARYRTPPRHRAIVHVVCPGRECGRMVGRVDLPVDDPRHPAFVTWLGGRQAEENEDEPMGEGPEGYWIGRFPLVREFERAPTRIWFSATCPMHGPVEVRLSVVWAAVRAKVRRPTRVAGLIYPSRRMMI
jgi:hypothetical protein